MPDVMSPEQRKKAMRSNRGRTKPERALASQLWRRALRYYTAQGYARLSGVKLPGSPDIIFPRIKVAVFVDGCFWHGCPVCGKVKKDMSEYWLTKIRKNKERDNRVDDQLIQMGWTPIRVWEHEVNAAEKLRCTADSLATLLKELARAQEVNRSAR